MCSTISCSQWRASPGSEPCPPWVIFGSRRPHRRGLLCPHKRTSSVRPVRSEKCQQRKWKNQFDQRPNASAIRRDESCLEPCLGLCADCPGLLRGDIEEIGC